MTSFGQSNSKGYSLSHRVNGEVIVVSTEISGAPGLGRVSFVHTEFPPGNVWCAIKHSDLESCEEVWNGA